MRLKYIIIFIMGAIAGAAAFAESRDTSYDRPVTVRTLSYVDVHYLHDGSTFYVKVNPTWTGLGCSLFNGQVLEGRVELATRRGKGQKESQLAVSFPKVPCLGGKSTLNLVLTAVEWDSGMTGIPHAQYPSLDRGMPTSDLSLGRQSGLSTNGISLSSMADKTKSMAPLRPGDVHGIDGVTMEIGKGPQQSSLLKSTKRDVYLEKDALLVLEPDSIAFAKGNEADLPRLLKEPTGAELAEASSPAGINVVRKAAPPLPAPVEFQECEPPACAVDLPSSASVTEGAPSKSIGILGLGYAPRPQQGMVSLNDDVALAWLGPQQVLVAFNPHKLIERDTERLTGAAVRRIHAVVLEPATSKVLSSADWLLPDEGEFLWQLSGGRVLVHVGNELRIYREGMQIERQIALDGPLEFVRLSPNEELIAIATVRETHTPEQHGSLRESLGSEPPENVEIRVLDKDFQTVAQATTSSEIMPPALLNDGQVQLLAKPNGRYRLALAPWKGEAKTIARFASACVPEVSSFAPDLLLVATCELNSGTREYRVLRPDGKVVLRAQMDPLMMGQSAQGNGRSFAVKILHSSQEVIRGSVFRGTDLDYEEVRVFQSNDGRRLTSVRLPVPPPTHGAFALSPDGAQLAVIADAKVNLYTLPAQ